MLLINMIEYITVCLIDWLIYWSSIVVWFVWLELHLWPIDWSLWWLIKINFWIFTTVNSEVYLIKDQFKLLSGRSAWAARSVMEWDWRKFLTEYEFCGFGKSNNELRVSDCRRDHWGSSGSLGSPRWSLSLTVARCCSLLRQLASDSECQCFLTHCRICIRNQAAATSFALTKAEMQSSSISAQYWMPNSHKNMHTHTHSKNKICTRFCISISQSINQCRLNLTLINFYSMLNVCWLSIAWVWPNFLTPC